MIKPLRDVLVVERLPNPDRLIILTDAEPSRRFKVIAVGPKVTEVRVGDIVLLPGVAAEQPDLEVGKQLFVTEGDVGFKIN
jgi:co-chaperonin GroES (HSP10)